MKMKILAVALASTFLGGCSNTTPTSFDDSAPRVLVYSNTAWYRHPEVPAISGWLAGVGMKHGMVVHVTETPKDLSAKKLADYDVLVLNSTTDIGKSLDDAQKQAVIDWFRAGGGIVGLHAALVHHDHWPWFTALAGCDFDSDSEFVPARVVVDPGAVDHPIMRGFGREFVYTADWTNHTKSVTGLDGVQVLARVDETTYEPVRPYFQQRGGKPMGADHPVIWTRTFEGGRFFYTELGHDVRSLNTPFGIQHVIEGIRWTAADRIAARRATEQE